MIVARDGAIGTAAQAGHHASAERLVGLGFRY